MSDDWIRIEHFRKSSEIAFSELRPGLPPVLGDRIQLQQVMLNLIMNGIESMTSSTDRPRLLLIRSLPQESGHVLVAVQDSGAGLDEIAFPAARDFAGGARPTRAFFRRNLGASGALAVRFAALPL